MCDLVPSVVSSRFLSSFACLFFMSQCLTNGRFVFWNNRVVHGDIAGEHVCPEYIKQPSVDGWMDR